MATLESAERSVTPLAPAIVTCPAPPCPIVISVAVGKATEAYVGTVNVAAVAFVTFTSFPASPATRV